MAELNCINEKMEESLKHSKLGIASFIIGIFTGIMEIVCVIEAAIQVTYNTDSVAMVIVGLFIILGCIFSLFGICVGIAGVVQKKCKKVFSIIGLILNATTLILIIGLMVIGSIA